MSNFEGRTLGPYKLEAALGKGGMATVYRAFQTTVKRYVAVKVMSPEIAENPGFVERFTREAEVIASLQHPHILPIIDYGEADGVHFLVMRYIENGSLEDRMRKRPLTLEESARFIEQIASALDYAHKRGVVHRDFKPNNVLLDAEENAYLTDFGIARLTQGDSKLTATGTVMGTPAYMSPEQGMGKPVDGRSDIYSLGIVLYEMVLNRLPFSADTPAALIFQHVYETPTPPKQVRPDLPDGIAAVILRTIAKDPDARYQSAAEVSRAFLEALGIRPASTPPGGTQPEWLSTIVGGPSQSVAGGQSTPRTQPQTPAALDGSTLAPGTLMPRPPGTQSTPPVPPTAPPRVPPAGGATPSTPLTSAPAPAATPGGSLPLPLIVVALLILLALIGGGGYALITNNNQNATNAANTAVAILALSATATPSRTFTPTPTVPTTTATPSNTATPTITFTPSATPTLTPNQTSTALAQQMNTVAAFNGNQTATVVAAINGTLTMQANLAATQLAIASQTAGVKLTGTARAIGSATAAANQEAAAGTLTEQSDQAATSAAVASMTAAAGSQATLNATSKTYSGPPELVMSTLQKDGLLTSIVGSTVIQRDQVDVNGDTPNYYRWKQLDANLEVVDFVAATDVVWDSPAETDACGFLFRFSEPEKNKQNFYSSLVGANGRFNGFIFADGSFDKSFADKASGTIKTGDKALNHLLLIGQGNAFRFFVNGKQVGSFSLNRFDKGTIAVMTSTGETTGVVCHFTNSWVWELGGQEALTAGLTSNDPATIITTLAQAGEIAPGSATVAAQDKRHALAAEISEQKVFYHFAVGTGAFQNFVMSTDITWAAESPKQTACGVIYNGSKLPDNMVAVYYYRDGAYYVTVRQNAKWADGNVTSGSTDAVKGDNGATNRMTIIVLSGKATIYLNGQLAFSAEDSTFNQGNVGYFLLKGTEGGAESCRFANTIVWAVK